MKKKIGAMALSLALASAICVPTAAFADDYSGSQQETEDMTGVAQTGTGSVTTTGNTSVLTGKIKATTLSVSVPTAVTFNIDPGAAQGVADPAVSDATPGTSQKRGQFTSPTNYTIHNASQVAVYVTVDSVTATGATLTDTQASIAAKVTGTGAADPVVMVGLSDADNNGSLALGNTAGWFKTSPATGLGIYPFGTTADKGRLDPDDNAANGTDEATMMVYGAVAQTGWTEADTFTVTPTLKISTTAV